MIKQRQESFCAIWIWALTLDCTLRLCTPLDLSLSLLNHLLTQHRDSPGVPKCVCVIKVQCNQTLGNSPSTLPAFSPNTARQEEEVAGQEMQERDGSHACVFLSVLLALRAVAAGGDWPNKSSRLEATCKDVCPVSSVAGTPLRDLIQNWMWRKMNWAIIQRELTH